MRELAADYRTDLCDLLGRGEAVEPRYQGALQSSWNQGRRGAVRLCGRLQHGLGQLFDEQRDPVALSDNPLAQRGGQYPFDRSPFSQLRRLLLRQSPECNHAGDGKTDPGRLKFRTMRHDEQNG